VCVLLLETRLIHTHTHTSSSETNTNTGQSKSYFLLTHTQHTHILTSCVTSSCHKFSDDGHIIQEREIEREIERERKRERERVLFVHSTTSSNIHRICKIYREN